MSDPALAEAEWDDVDPGIRPVVAALNAAGFRTIASCQGHGTDDAWVVVLPTEEKVGQTALDLETFLVEQGWDDGAVLEVGWLATPRASRRRWIKVSWWGRVPFR